MLPGGVVIALQSTVCSFSSNIKQINIVIEVWLKPSISRRSELFSVVVIHADCWSHSWLSIKSFEGCIFDWGISCFPGMRPFHYAGLGVSDTRSTHGSFDESVLKDYTWTGLQFNLNELLAVAIYGWSFIVFFLFLDLLFLLSTWRWFALI